uniref:Uncharacterized protein n=1 Tax=Glossina austeni TaxID=7395 RepID=A0A1A9UGN4_GLOAU
MVQSIYNNVDGSASVHYSFLRYDIDARLRYGLTPTDSCPVTSVVKGSSDLTLRAIINLKFHKIAQDIFSYREVLILNIFLNKTCHVTIIIGSDVVLFTICVANGFYSALSWIGMVFSNAFKAMLMVYEL